MVGFHHRGGSRGRVQGVRNPPPPPPEMTCGFLIQLVFCKKKTIRFIGCEVEQETCAPPPKKNPGSAPASTMSICSSSISVCRKERKTVVDLYLPKKQPTFCISPRNMMSVSERTVIFYQNGRSLATFLKGVVYVVKHWQRLLLFLYCIYLLCYKFTSFVNVFPGK